MTPVCCTPILSTTDTRKLGVGSAADRLADVGGLTNTDSSVTSDAGGSDGFPANSMLVDDDDGFRTTAGCRWRAARPGKNGMFTDHRQFGDACAITYQNFIIYIGASISNEADGSFHTSTEITVILSSNQYIWLCD